MDGAYQSSCGAVCVQQAQLSVVDCKVHRNVASGGDRAHGGAFYFAPGSEVLIKHSDVSSNVASGGALLSHGGGIFSDIRDTGELRIESTVLSQNCATSSAARAAGGGLYSMSGSATVMDSDLTGNVASGQTTYGGAVYSMGTTLVIRTNISKNRISSVGVDGEAFGGGMFNGGTMLRLVDSHLFENVASIESPAFKVSAGAVYNARGARVILDGCRLRSNAAGGRGYFEGTAYSYNDDSRAAYEALKAAHVFTAGRAEVIRTAIVETERNIELIEYAARTWIVVEGGTLYLGASNFSAATESDALPWLLASSTADAEVLVRQCSVRNLKLQSAAKVGVVNSEFEPPLNGSVFASFGQGECARVVANQKMCDPRAPCELRQTAGGVPNGLQCACVGPGLRSKPGVPEDGRQCEQDASLRAVLESESVAIAISKPGSLTNRTLTLISEAHGEAELAVAFSITVTRLEASSGAMVAANGSILVDQPSMSAFGQHIEWRSPPAAIWRADLDGSKLKFADSLRHEFTVRLACGLREQSCAADGDVITTVVQLTSPQDSRLRSEVRVVTQVQSLLSCTHTRATASVKPDSESSSVSTPMRLRLFANDADNLPVSFTRAEINLVFGGRNVPVQKIQGSNEYVADVPAERTAQPGVYDLVVSASNVWNETGPAPSCELLRRTITVKEGLSTNSILGSAGAAAVVVTGGLFILVRKRHAHLQGILVMLFTEVFRLPTSHVRPRVFPLHGVSSSRQPSMHFEHHQNRATLELH
jgi:hypothetical protein